MHFIFHLSNLAMVFIVSRVNGFEESVDVAMYQISVRLKNCTSIPYIISSHIKTTNIKVVHL